MYLIPVIEALQATLVPQMRKQAEENLVQVTFITKNALLFYSQYILVLQNTRFYPMSHTNYS